MKYNLIKVFTLLAILSLLGILFTQTFWLRKTYYIAENQYHHRTDKMLSDIVNELKMYADTSDLVHSKTQPKFFEVIDTNLLNELVYKYARYHQLDSVVSFGLVKTECKKIIYSKNGFNDQYESKASMICLSCIWQKEYIHLSAFFPNKQKNIINEIILWIVLSIIFIAFIFSALIFNITTLFKQKKVAEIKNDFINNMTHELKTPLATISVASEVLLKAREGSDFNKLKRYPQIIFDENHKMRKLVDQVLNIATLEKGLLDINKSEVDIHKAIYAAIGNTCVSTCDKEIDVTYQLNATESVILGDSLHINNIISNLIDNAVKYSGDKPKLMITTESNKDFFIFSVGDNGKGIPKESVGKVFDKFYRVPTGNIHNVKGFGLGLYYVKTMVDSHNGTIEIKSQLNKGTIVIVSLPKS